MKKCFPTLIASMIGYLLCNQYAIANLADQCLLNVPHYDQPVVNDDIENLPVNISSQEAHTTYPDKTTFDGDVIIQQGNRTLQANRAEIERRTIKDKKYLDRFKTHKIASAKGNVYYHDNLIRLTGTKAQINLDNKDADIDDSKYQTVGKQGRGTAKKVKIRENNQYTILKEGSFTTCLPGDDSWSVAGSTVIQDRENETAEIWNARFKIGPVPIFYSPYLRFPIGNKRQSGLLIPNAKYSEKSGFEFIQPYYWNIAPNYDATITPHYYSRRGLQWQTEFRYLIMPGTGILALDWLPNDRIYDDQKIRPEEKHKRWLFHWGHNGLVDKVWRFNVDYTRVSDPYYFTDFDSNYGSSTDGYATQKFSLGYSEKNWNTTISSKKFQVFSTAINANAYRAEPEIDFNYYKNDLGPIDFKLYGQLAKFISEADYNPKATRIHVEPTLDITLANQWASFNGETKLMATHYQQNIPHNYNGAPLRNSVNRVLPELKLDSKMVFERNTLLFSGYTQTLEPRVQYLYIPYKDQSGIYPYDSTLMQIDYTGLFRDKIYSGLDRIASANQIATGIASRFYDKDLIERFNISIGQIYYFHPSKTGEAINNFDKPSDDGSQAWASDAYWKISDLWGLRAGLQYDPRIKRLSIGNAVVEYQGDSNKLLQLNYRYASPEYIKSALPNVSTNKNFYDKGISQLGIIGSVPLANRWAVVGAYYYDTKRQQTADSLLGIQYNTCCWAVRLGYNRKIDGWNNISKASQYENKISFNMELRGFGNDYSLGTQSMLNSGVLPYQRAF